MGLFDALKGRKEKAPEGENSGEKLVVGGGNAAEAQVQVGAQYDSPVKIAAANEKPKKVAAQGNQVKTPEDEASAEPAEERKTPEQKLEEIKGMKFRKPPEFMAQPKKKAENTQVHLTMEEADMVHGLVESIEPAKEKFKREEVKRQVLEGGFSERVAEEVAKRLYG